LLSFNKKYGIAFWLLDKCGSGVVYGEQIKAQHGEQQK
jgi:hypothetical protein